MDLTAGRCRVPVKREKNRASKLVDSIAQGLLEVAYPTRCVICDMPGALLCASCRLRLPIICQADACRKCGAPYGHIVCTECWKGDGLVEYPFERAVCAMEFNDYTGKLVTEFKDAGELGLKYILARLIEESMKSAGLCLDNSVLTYIPDTPEAVRRRGYDHMQLVAEQMASDLGVNCKRVFDKQDRRDQRELGREERMENMRGAFALRQNLLQQLSGSNLILIDDVFTTGSTLSTATMALKEAGIKSVTVVAGCRVW